MFKRGKHWQLTILSLIVTLPLSACLVKKEKIDRPTEIIQRSTDTLRIYKDGDFIVYNVQINNPIDIETVHGSLRIEWKDAGFIDNPLDTEINYKALKETSTLTLDDGGEKTSVRFISQDAADTPTAGTVRLIALGGGVERYWLNKTVNIKPTTVAPIVIFESPLHINTNMSIATGDDAYVIEDCSSSTRTCGDATTQLFSDTLEVRGDSTSINTNLGRFSNPFDIRYEGSSQLQGGSITPVDLFDIRNSCATAGISTRHRGSLFLLPEIGMMQMTNFCQDSTGQQTIYEITFDHSNISLP